MVTLELLAFWTLEAATALALFLISSTDLRLVADTADVCCWLLLEDAANVSELLLAKAAVLLAAFSMAVEELELTVLLLALTTSLLALATLLLALTTSLVALAEPLAREMDFRAAAAAPPATERCLQAWRLKEKKQFCQILDLNHHTFCYSVMYVITLRF